MALIQGSTELNIDYSQIDFGGGSATDIVWGNTTATVGTLDTTTSATGADSASLWTTAGNTITFPKVKANNKIYKNRIVGFPSFEDCEYKYHELRARHSAISKWQNKTHRVSDWYGKRMSKASKEMQLIIGALAIYNGQLQGFTNKL